MNATNTTLTEHGKEVATRIAVDKLLGHAVDRFDRKEENLRNAGWTEEMIEEHFAELGHELAEKIEKGTATFEDKVNYLALDKR